jgi:hypothetical protein
VKEYRVSNNNNNNDSQQEEVRINPAMKRHYDLEIKRDVAKCSKRCEDKLRELLKSGQSIITAL